MAPSTDTKKRKADASTAPKAKKARPAAPGATTVKAILSDTANYHIPESDVDIRASLVELAEYARSLEEEIESMKPKPLSKDEVEVAAEKLRKVVNSGIRKQMTVNIPILHTNALLTARATVEADLQNQLGTLGLRRDLLRSSYFRSAPRPV